MDIGTLLGYVLGAVFLGFSTFLAVDYSIPGLLAYVDPPSMLIVFGGTICSIIIGFPTAKIRNALKASKLIFRPPVLEATGAIDAIIRLANLARKEGILALEDAVTEMNDNFLQKGIMLIVDGTDPELTRNILETELMYLEDRHKESKGIWESAASVSPSWGMIGTLIGLIAMLLNLDDPGAMGPMMAIALVTTFYGVVLANWIFTPIANKIKTYSGEELLMKSVMIEGMLSIQAGENPRIIEEKLRSFLAPAARDAIGASDRKEGE